MKKTSVVLLSFYGVIFLVACNGGSSATSVPTPTTTPTPTPTISPTPVIESNYVSVAVGIGKTNNTPSITVTVCQPNTTICQTIDKIILDTGSFGLKINQSQLTQLNLPSINQIGSNLPISACNLYGSGYVFASANYADVYIGGEKASNIPIQIIDDGDQSNVPTSCTSQGALVDFNAWAMNGIIGINPKVYLDNDSNFSYTCTNGSCSTITDGIPVKYLNVNPVSAFAVDNNGESLSFPAVYQHSESVIYGTLTFGLNTKSNNQLPSNIMSVKGDPNDLIGRFWGYGSEVPFYTLFDTGTNYFNFYSTEIPYCDAGFYIYCPDTTMTWSSYIFSYDVSGDHYQLDFPISLPESYYPVSPEIGIYMPAEHGLYGQPFFFGRNVYIGFIGESTSMGPGPTWGYVNQ